MRLLIVRHGDPDYSIDSLTEKRLERKQNICQKDCQNLM